MRVRELITTFDRKKNSQQSCTVYRKNKTRETSFFRQKSGGYAIKIICVFCTVDLYCFITRKF